MTCKTPVPGGARSGPVLNNLCDGAGTQKTRRRIEPAAGFCTQYYGPLGLKSGSHMQVNNR